MYKSMKCQKTDLMALNAMSKNVLLQDKFHEQISFDSCLYDNIATLC